LTGAYFAARVKVRVHSDKEEKREALKELVSIAFPLIAAEAVLNVVSMTDTSVLRNRMLAAGLSADDARFLYGAYTGYALTIFNLPVGILGTIGISLLPAVAGAVASGDVKRAQKPLGSGIGLTLFISVPCAVMMWIMPDRLLYLLFRNTSSALMLKYMAPCVVFVSLTQMLSAVIQACGRVALPSVMVTGGLIVKIAVMWKLCAMPSVNIYGAVIGTNIAYFLVLAADIAILKKITGLKLGILRELIIPGAASAVMAYAVMYVAHFCGNGVFSTIAVCAVGGSVYILTAAAMMGARQLFSRRNTRDILPIAVDAKINVDKTRKL
jgi:stage V sporulation protein B